MANGHDHAGIATQMLVERQPAEENLNRHDLGRDTFVDRVWAWKEELADYFKTDTPHGLEH